VRRARAAGLRGHSKIAAPRVHLHQNGHATNGHIGGGLGPGQVQERDGRAERREVTVGQRYAGEIEITKGLQPGELLVTRGLQRIRPGAPLQITNNNRPTI